MLKQIFIGTVALTLSLSANVPVFAQSQVVIAQASEGVSEEDLDRFANALVQIKVIEQQVLISIIQQFKNQGFSQERFEAIVKAQQSQTPLEPELTEEEKVKLSNIVKIYFKFKDPFPKKDVSLMHFCPTNETMRKSAFGWIYEIERIAKSDWWMLWVVGDLIEVFQKSDTAENFLLDVLQNIKRQYPKFPQEAEIDTDKVLTYDWGSDPCYQGGYSYFETGGNIEEIVPLLREHVIHGEEDENQCRLIISGEITHQQFYSTTHAGFAAGIRDGKDIARILNL